MPPLAVSGDHGRGWRGWTGCGGQRSAMAGVAVAADGTDAEVV